MHWCTVRPHLQPAGLLSSALAHVRPVVSSSGVDFRYAGSQWLRAPKDVDMHFPCDFFGLESVRVL